jgi:hypothetical protein
MEKILYPLILALVFTLILISDFPIRLHELGHSIGCMLAGGEIKQIVINKTSGYIICDIKDPSHWQKFLIYASGVYAEILFASVLLAIPYTSALGGMVLSRVGFLFYKGVYSSDMQALGLKFLTEYPWGLLIWLITTIVFLVSAYIYGKSWKKLLKVRKY